MAKHIIISGGGTGGHIYPAIAIADALRQADAAIKLHFVGALGKMEMELVPKAGYPIIGLPMAGFQRRLTLQNLTFPFKLLKSLSQAWGIVSKIKPDAVVGVGGYASAPIMAVASQRGIPVFIQEQNSYAGVTNKLMAARARNIFVAFPHMEQFFPAEKIIFTGNPVRQDLQTLSGKKTAAATHFGLSADRPTVLITGGSLGAKTLNESMRAQTDLIAQYPNMQFIWQCGKLYHQTYQHCDTAALPNVKIVPFLERVDLAYAIATVVIARAGALTVSELCLAQKPAILIPSPNVAEDHQTKNAQSLVTEKAALMLPDTHANEMLAQAIALAQNPAQQHVLKTNLARLARPYAAQQIATEILKRL